jgi:hypothetical protein|tara:strand:+ start:1868 stop:2041 length:174 start_codon:yes stop_codon:yes gene_type:complete
VEAEGLGVQEAVEAGLDPVEADPAVTFTARRESEGWTTARRKWEAEAGKRPDKCHTV